MFSLATPVPRLGSAGEDKPDELQDIKAAITGPDRRADVYAEYRVKSILRLAVCATSARLYLCTDTDLFPGF